MKHAFEVCLVGLFLIGPAGSQDYQPALRKGVSVEMAVASHAVEMRAADEQDATVVVVTADGSAYVGTKPAGLAALSSLTAATVYVKADFRAPFQKVLAVLDALRGPQAVLLTAPPGQPEKGKIVPPYGVKLMLAR